MKDQDYELSVFINCPFDDEYRPFFHAAIFVIIACGFHPRSALEADDGTENRLTKISKIIHECHLGIHDLSRTLIDKKTKLPRFNMPFELGLFLGAKHYGSGKQKKKSCLIFDKDKYRYREFISDIAGHDIHEHDLNLTKFISKIRNWLSHHDNRHLPGDDFLAKIHQEFAEIWLPALVKEKGLNINNLGFPDYERFVTEWLK